MDKWSIFYMGAIFSCDSPILEALWQIVYRPSCREVWSKLPDHCSLDTILEDLRKISKTLPTSHWKFSSIEYYSGILMDCGWIFYDRANDIAEAGNVCVYINNSTEVFLIKEFYCSKYPQTDNCQKSRISMQIDKETMKCESYKLGEQYFESPKFSTLKEQILFANEQLQQHINFKKNLLIN